MQSLDVRTGRDHKTGKERLLESLIGQLENKVMPLQAVASIAAEYSIEPVQVQEIIFEGAHKISSEVIQYLRHSASISAYESGKTASEIASICKCTEEEVSRIILTDRITKLKAIEYDIRAPDTDKKYANSPEYLRVLGRLDSNNGITPYNVFGSMPESKLERTEAPPGLPSHLAVLYECPPLSGAQERHLFSKYNFLKCYARKLLSKIDINTADEASISQVENLYKAAHETRNIIATHSLRLVASVARRTDRAEDLPSRLSEGNQAMLRAIDTFDYLKGNRFSTYVSWAVSNTLIRRYSERLERSKHEVVMEFRSAESRTPHPLTRLFKKEYLEGCSKILKELDPQKREIIELYFGLNGRDSVQQKDIAAALGISRSAVQKLYQEAQGELLALAVSRRVALPFDSEIRLKERPRSKVSIRESISELELLPVESHIISELDDGSKRSAGELKLLVSKKSLEEVSYNTIAAALLNLVKRELVRAAKTKFPLYELNWDFSLFHQAKAKV